MLDNHCKETLNNININPNKTEERYNIIPLFNLFGKILNTSNISKKKSEDTTNYLKLFKRLITKHTYYYTINSTNILTKTEYESIPHKGQYIREDYIVINYKTLKVQAIEGNTVLHFLFGIKHDLIPDIIKILQTNKLIDEKSLSIKNEKDETPLHILFDNLFYNNPKYVILEEGYIDILLKYIKLYDIDFLNKVNFLNKVSTTESDPPKNNIYLLLYNIIRNIEYHVRELKKKTAQEPKSASESESESASESESESTSESESKIEKNNILIAKLSTLIFEILDKYTSPENVTVLQEVFTLKDHNNKTIVYYLFMILSKGLKNNDKLTNDNINTIIELIKELINRELIKDPINEKVPGKAYTILYYLLHTIILFIKENTNLDLKDPLKSLIEKLIEKRILTKESTELNTSYQSEKHITLLDYMKNNCNDNNILSAILTSLELNCGPPTNGNSNGSPPSSSNSSDQHDSSGSNGNSQSQ
jgi:hypothetical protein